MAVQIRKSELEALVNSGKKADEIAAHYGIPLFTARKALKAAGLKIKRSQKERFELVDDTEPANEPVVEQTVKKSRKKSVETTVETDIKENIVSHEETTPETLPSNDYQETNEPEVETEADIINEENTDYVYDDEYGSEEEESVFDKAEDASDEPFGETPEPKKDDWDFDNF